MLPLLTRHWFLLLLVALLAIGMAGAPWLTWLADVKWARLGIMAAVMFVMAFPIPAEEIGRTIARPWAALLATGINLGVLPLLAWALSLPFPINELKLREGILIAAATPCTVASAAVWTRRAGGNDAAALLVTMITNALCFVVTPHWLHWTTGEQAAFSPEQIWQMVWELGLLVLLPMLLAQLVRLIPAVGLWASDQKDLLAAAAMAGVLSMVFLAAIKSGETLYVVFGDPSIMLHWGEVTMQIAAASVVTLGIHVAMLAFGWSAATAAGMSWEDRVAVSIAGSQKTLMVGLHLALTHFGGLSMLPMVVYHCGQLVIDSIVAEHWAEMKEASGE